MAHRRISNIAFQCWSNTDSDPFSALLVVNNNVYYDHWRATEAKRERLRRFSRQFENQNEVIP